MQRFAGISALIRAVSLGLMLSLGCGWGLAAPKLSQVPPRARETILARTANGTIERLERVVENGENVYEVDWKKDQVQRSLTVAEDGTLLSSQVLLSEVPSAAQTAIRTQLGDATLRNIFWTDDLGEISFEVEVTRNGKAHSFSVTPEGKLLSVQVSLAETPAPVRKTVQAHLGKARLGEVHRVVEDDETTYAIETHHDGKKQSFNVAADGEFLSYSVLLAETPPPVQKTVKQQVENGRLGEIERSEAAGESTYDVRTFSNGRRRSFTVAADGRITSLQVLLSETPAPVQQKIQEQSDGASIVRIDRTSQGRETLYEVETKKLGKKVVFLVSADGKLERKADPRQQKPERTP